MAGGGGWPDGVGGRPAPPRGRPASGGGGGPASFRRGWASGGPAAGWPASGGGYRPSGSGLGGGRRGGAGVGTGTDDLGHVRDRLIEGDTVALRPVAVAEGDGTVGHVLIAGDG